MVKHNLGSLRACTSSAPASGGDAAVQFVIDRNGGVQGARTSGSSFGQGTGDCLTRALGSMPFPAPTSGIATVELQLALRT